MKPTMRAPPVAHRAGGKARAFSLAARSDVESDLAGAVPQVTTDVAARGNGQVAALVRIPGLPCPQGGRIAPVRIGRPEHCGQPRCRRPPRIERCIAPVAERCRGASGVHTEARHHPHVAAGQQLQVALAGAQHTPQRRAQLRAIDRLLDQFAAAIAVVGDRAEALFGHAEDLGEFLRRHAHRRLVAHQKPSPASHSVCSSTPSSSATSFNGRLA
ncbi:hypothetical protein G6F63_013895 [Rhizopus arrhizus]|nr:hypothetical protein G6F63_013895 [Rhizopus arrhizus]